MAALSAVCVILLASAALCLEDAVPPQRSIASARYTNSWAVELVGESASDAERIARKYGFRNLGVVGNLKKVYHFQLAVDVTTNLTTGGYKTKQLLAGSLAEMDHTPHLTTQLEGEKNIVMVEQQTIISHEHYCYHYQQPNDAEWSSQWSLKNTGQTSGPTGLDLNVEPAWLQGVTGSGVVVAVFDNGLETTHPDLRNNYDSYASWDFVYDDPDPTPDNYYGDEPDSHGTMCAGVVAMERDNEICGVGVAYDCNIAGLKLSYSTGTYMMRAEGLGHLNNYIDIYSNSWAPPTNGFTVGGWSELVQRTLAMATSEGRGGKGCIYVWAAGNGGESFDSCAANGYVSSIYSIAMGSADQSGGQASYDEQCAAKMAVTFSLNSPQGLHLHDQLRTSTLNADCTDSFTGTSASTPLAAGVIALTLQANPNLSWRDVQYLIAYTSNRDSLTGGEWTTNGAGLQVSHKFGFGAVDAEAMVTRARRWTNVPEQHSSTVYGTWGPQQVGLITMTFDVTDSSAGGISFLEHVVVTATLSLSDYTQGYSAADYDNQYFYDNNDRIRWLTDPHPRRGDIKIELTSPDSTTSVLLPYRNYDFVNEEGYDNWPFMSVHHWGENPVGRWTLKVHFISSGGTITASSVSMTLYGTTTTPQSVSNIPYFCDFACARGCSGEGANNCDVCNSNYYRIAQTLECVYQCPYDMQTYGKYCLSGDSPTNVPPTTIPTSPPDTTAPPPNTIPISPPDTTGMPPYTIPTSPSDTTSPPTSLIPNSEPLPDSHTNEPENSISNGNLVAVIGGTVGGIAFIAVGIIIAAAVIVAILRRRSRSPSEQGFIPLESQNHTNV